MSNLTDKSRSALINALGRELDTRDKAFMFLRIEFRDLVSRIDLEGSPHTRAWNIYSEFEKQQMLGSLMACLNARFDTDIEFELRKEK